MGVVRRGAGAARGRGDGQREGVLRGAGSEGYVRSLITILSRFFIYPRIICADGWKVFWGYIYISPCTDIANSRTSHSPEWNTKNSSSQQQQQQPQKLATPPSGFAGISRRGGKKPIIAAVNGPCLGGGCELVINADLVLASRRHAYFALPEVKRGVVAIAGGLPRLVRTVGKQRAMEMALTGRNVSAEEAERWGLVNELVDGEADAVVKRAVEVAETIAANSPDAVIVSREGVKMGWEGVGVEDGSRLLIDAWERRLYEGENMKEGVRAFVEKRAPRWVDSKL